MPTYLSDKIRKQFYNFNFLGGHFVTRTSLLFGNKHKILDFSYPIRPISRKKFHLSQGLFFQILQQKKMKKDRNTTK